MKPRIGFDKDQHLFQQHGGKKADHRATLMVRLIANDISAGDHGCQMAYFQTKNTNLGKFLKALDWKMLIYFMYIWNILRTFGKFYDHLVYLV
jgi:hypothetical protein